MSRNHRRSIVLVSADQRERAREVLLWGPDVLCLDLGNCVSSSQREAACRLLPETLDLAHAQGVAVMIRISADQHREDLTAVIQPGLSGVVIPGIETPREIRELDEHVSALEARQKISDGDIKFMVFLDQGQGLWHAREIIGCSRRVDALALGLGDLAFDMLKEPETVPFFTGPVPRFPVPEYVWGRLALIAADARVSLIGLLGTTIAPGYAHSGKLLAAVKLAQQAGFVGAFTIHREGVEGCNQAFLCMEKLEGL